MVEMEHPVGVSAVELTIGIYHFRLDPEAESHSSIYDLLGNRPQPGRVLRWITDPVTKPDTVPVPPDKPAIIEHKPLNSKTGGVFYQALERFFIMIKI